jgi:hypothetical protein
MRLLLMALSSALVAAIPAQADLIADSGIVSVSDSAIGGDASWYCRVAQIDCEQHSNGDGRFIAISFMPMPATLANADTIFASRSSQEAAQTTAFNTMMTAIAFAAASSARTAAASSAHQSQSSSAVVAAAARPLDNSSSETVTLADATKASSVQTAPITLVPIPMAAAPVAVPGPILGSAIPGVIAACLGLLALARRRIRRSLAFA